MLCKHSSPLALKNFQTDGRFSGYGSVFKHLDLHNDIVWPGAFSRTLKEWNAKGELPKMLWQHDVMKPIGMWERIREDERGLYVEGQIFLDLIQGREAYTLLKHGVVDGLSIGFEIVEAQASNQGRIIRDIELYEISLVTFAANPLAKVTDCKNWEGESSDELQPPMVYGYLKELKSLLTNTL